MARGLNDSLWHQLTEEITTGMREWRSQHAKATLREIETELDTRLSRLRVRLLEDLALTSTTAVWADTTAPPLCPDCQTPLEDTGVKSRTLQTHGGQELTLTRSYGSCPACKKGLFPPR